MNGRVFDLTVERAFPREVWTVVLPCQYDALRVEGGIVLFADRADGLRVAASAAKMDDGITYIHASCSRVDRLPDYSDLADLKRLFFGPNRFAAQVFPPDSQHVNIHKFCLHLWGPLDATKWPFPDFTLGSGSI